MKAGDIKMKIQKSIKKTMALLLAIVMMMGIMPLTGAAELEITPVEIETDVSPPADPPEDNTDNETPNTNPDPNETTPTEPPPETNPEDITDPEIDLNIELAESSDDITTSFTDPNFLAYIREELTKPHPEPILKSDVEGILSVLVDNKNIASLAGIQHFTSLEYLTAIDNNLTTLNLSGNIHLKDLYVNGNNLTTLDLSNNTALEWLHAQENQLTTLNVSNSAALKELYVWRNRLTTLNVSNNTALTTLIASENRLTALNVTNNIALTNLNIWGNQLTTLDVSRNTALTDLSVGDNQLTSLNVSSNTALTNIFAADNRLASFNVSSNTALTHLNVRDNQLTSLNVSSNTALTFLEVGSNQLTTLNVSSNAALTDLYAYQNQLATTLDISNMPNLENVDAAANNLTSVNITNTPKLERLNVQFNIMNDENDIIGLDVKGSAFNLNFWPQRWLATVTFEDWDGTVLATRQVEQGDSVTPPSAPTRVGFRFTGWSAFVWGFPAPWLTVNDVIEFDTLFIAQYRPNNDRTLNESDIPDPNFRRAIRNNLGIWNDGPIRLSAIVNMTELYVSGHDISNLTGIGLFTSLRMLDCNNNNLTTLDLSRNPALSEVNCSRNNLRSLILPTPVPTGTGLTLLDCSSNQLTTLNLTNSPNLDELHINNNRLTALDLSNNRKLHTLYVQRNRLPSESAINGLSYLTLGSYQFAPQNDIPANAATIITNDFIDTNFRAAVRQIAGLSPTDDITIGDVFDLSYLNVSGRGISSLAGVERLTQLEHLNCSNNQMASIDLSANTALKTLDCSNNQLTSLNVNANPALETLYCVDNRLTSLSVSNNTQLRELDIVNNEISALVLTANTQLERLSASYNKLTALDLSNNGILEDLVITHNQITKLDLSNNPYLWWVIVNNNDMEELVLSNNENLGYLQFTNNKLTELNLSDSPYLWSVVGMNNLLTKLDVSKNHNMDQLLVNNNELIEVNLSPNAHYWSIDLRQNRLTINAVTGRSDIRWGTGNFRFSPQKPLYNFIMELSQTGPHNFGTVALDYSAQTPLEITVTNRGDQPTGELTIALSGANASSFTLNRTFIPNLEVNGSAGTFTVVPNTGLPIGTYVATVTVSGGAFIAPRSFNLRFVVTRVDVPAPAAPTEVSGTRTTSSVTLNASSTLEYAMNSTNIAPNTGWRDAGVNSTITFSGLTQNTTYFFFARVKETATHSASPASGSLQIKTNAIPISLAISPSFTTATVGQLEPVILSVNIPQGEEPDSILWSIGSGVFTADHLNRSEIRLNVIVPYEIRQAVSVAVTIDGVVYRAHAEVNIVEDLDYYDRTARLGDNTAVINRAKRDAYVEVPIVLNYIPDEDDDRTVRLYENFGTNRQRELTTDDGPPADNISADITDNRIRPLTAWLNDDGTAIAIDYNRERSGTGNFNNLTVVIGDHPNPTNSRNIQVEGRLNVSIINRFPQRLAVVADQLDVFYMNETEVKLIDADGVVYDVTSITPRSNTARIEVIGDNRVQLLPGARAGNIPVTVEVNPGDYISLKSGGTAATRNTHNVNLRVVNNTPALRLSATTVTLLDDRFDTNSNFTGAATVRLLTRNVRIPFESFYEVESVRSEAPSVRNGIMVEVDYISRNGFGELSISPENYGNAVAGRTNLIIKFKGTDAEVTLPLNIRVFNPRNLNPSPASRTVTVNVSHTPGTDIVTLPINLNAANLVLPDWRVISVGGRAGGIDSFDSVLKDHIDFRVDGNNMITFSVKPGVDLSQLLIGNATNRTIQVRIGSEELMRMSGRTERTQRTVAVNLRIVKADATFTVSQRGRIDISNPESAIDATIRLNNTSERIEGVKLLEQRILGGAQVIPDKPSELFKAVHVPGENTFRIIAIGNVEPRTRYSLAIEIELEGRTLTSWIETGTGPDSTVRHRFVFNITPAQTISRAWMSANNVTLRAAMPHRGDDIRLNLTTPANVKLGQVSIQQSSLDNLRFIDENGTLIPNALVIEQNGADSWTIRFRDGEVPWGTVSSNGRTETELRNNYSIRLELWAEGTYVLDGAGNPTALRNARPTVITVRINIRL